MVEEFAIVSSKSIQSCLCSRLGEGGSSYSDALVTDPPKVIKDSKRAVRIHDLVVVEQTTVTSKHQNRSRHVTVVAAASSRVLNLGGELRFVLLVALASRHFGGEDARSDRVDANFAVLEGCGQHAAYMRCRCLAGRVGELAVAGTLHLTANRGDVDDLGGVARGDLAAFGEEWEHGHCHEVLSRDICLKGLSPLSDLAPKEVLADGVCVGHVWLAVGGCCCVSSRSRGVPYSGG